MAVFNHTIAKTYMLARLLPHFTRLSTCSSDHVSRSMDRTVAQVSCQFIIAMRWVFLPLLICVPILRWIPEHLQRAVRTQSVLIHLIIGPAYLMQMKIPKLQLVHLGWPEALQSAQTLLAGSLSKDLRICWFFSVVVFLVYPDDVGAALDR